MPGKPSKRKVESYSKEAILEYFDRYNSFWRGRIDYDLLDILESIAASKREDKKLEIVKQRIAQLESGPKTIKTSRQLRSLKHQEDDIWAGMLERMKREQKKRDIRQKKRDARDAQLSLSMTPAETDDFPTPSQI